LAPATSFCDFAGAPDRQLKKNRRVVGSDDPNYNEYDIFLTNYIVAPWNSGANSGRCARMFGRTQLRFELRGICQTRHGQLGARATAMPLTTLQK
jgi:hypothetical protein